MMAQERWLAGILEIRHNSWQIYCGYLSIAFFSLSLTCLTSAGTWLDDFEGQELRPDWGGNKEDFLLVDGVLQGRNAHPILLLPPTWIEVGRDWDDITVDCWINVVTPNLLECTKGALLLRHSGDEGYVFALHVATQTVEVYRLSNDSMLLKQDMPLEMEHWYHVRAVLQGPSMRFYLDGELIGTLNDNRSPAGSVGVAVQDALVVWFDDFSVTGPGVTPGGTPVQVMGTLSVIWGQIRAGD